MESVKMARNNVGYQRPTVKQKMCTRCRTWKLLSDFPLRGGIRLGHQSHCISCTKDYKKRLYARNNAFYSQKSREQYELKRNDLRFKLVRLLKGRLVSSGDLYNDIDIEYLLDLYEAQNGICALTGREFTIGNADDGLPSRDAISIDRIDRKFGYIKGNIRLVIYQVNIAKHRFDDEDLLDLCYATVRFFERNAETWGIVPDVSRIRLESTTELL
jgi:hypothetical protein